MLSVKKEGSIKGRAPTLTSTSTMKAEIIDTITRHLDQFSANLKEQFEKDHNDFRSLVLNLMDELDTQNATLGTILEAQKKLMDEFGALREQIQQINTSLTGEAMKIRSLVDIISSSKRQPQGAGMDQQRLGQSTPNPIYTHTQETKQQTPTIFSYDPVFSRK